MKAKIIMQRTTGHRRKYTWGEIFNRLGKKLREDYPAIKKNIFENVKLDGQQEARFASVRIFKSRLVFIYEISPVDMGVSCQKAL